MAAKTKKFRVEFQTPGGSWGADLIDAESAKDAESKVNRAEFAVSGTARATHQMDATTGQLLRIAG